MWADLQPELIVEVVRASSFKAGARAAFARTCKAWRRAIEVVGGDELSWRTLVQNDYPRVADLVELDTRLKICRIIGRALPSARPKYVELYRSQRLFGLVFEAVDPLYELAAVGVGKSLVAVSGQIRLHRVPAVVMRGARGGLRAEHRAVERVGRRRRQPVGGNAATEVGAISLARRLAELGEQGLLLLLLAELGRSGAGAGPAARVGLVGHR